MALQQIGGAPKREVLALEQQGAPLTPVTIDAGDLARFTRLLEPGAPAVPSAPDEAWVNFYRQDDLSATAYFYLDRPDAGLPALQPVPERTAGMPATERD